MEWYFDFISPYAYLQFKRLEARGLLDGARLTPILFAGVLKHWGQLGPAEIPPKRVFTYRQACWLARSQKVAFKMPSAHPFNPLKLLRLVLHLNVERAAVSRLFEFVWRDGFIPDDAVAWEGLVRQFGLDPDSAASSLNDAGLKERLKSNTDRAIAAGVFGVPTIRIGSQLFWGQDSTDMALDFMRDPAQFESDERIIATLPSAAARVAPVPKS